MVCSVCRMAFILTAFCKIILWPEARRNIPCSTVSFFDTSLSYFLLCLLLAENKSKCIDKLQGLIILARGVILAPLM